YQVPSGGARRRCNQVRPRQLGAHGPSGREVDEAAPRLLVREQNAGTRTQRRWLIRRHPSRADRHSISRLSGCEGLATASQETMQLAVLDGLQVVYIARHGGRQTLRLASEIGRNLP